MTPARGRVFRIEAKVEERIERLGGFEPDVAAAPAVAARRAAARDEFFTAKGRHAVPAVSTPNTNLDPINKQFAILDWRFH